MNGFVLKADGTLQSLQAERKSLNVLLDLLATDPPTMNTHCPTPFACADYDGGSSRFLFWVWGSPGGGEGSSPAAWRLANLNTSGNTLWKWPLREYRDSDKRISSDLLHQIASALDRQLSSSIEVYSKYIRRDPSMRSQLWSFWDFLYFSGITLTTIGYGDILPNTTMVRMLILGEALFGVFLLVWVINVIMINSNNPGSGRLESHSR